MHPIVGRPVYERGIVSFIRVLGDLMPRRSRKVRALSCEIDESDTCGRDADIMIICCPARLLLRVLLSSRFGVYLSPESKHWYSTLPTPLRRKQLIGNFVRKQSGLYVSQTHFLLVLQ